MLSRLSRCVLGTSVFTMGAAAQAQVCVEPCAEPVAINIDRSLVVHDADTLNAADFSFARTIGAIVASSGGGVADTATSREHFVDTLINTLNVTSATNGEAMPLDARPNEFGLVAADMLDPDSPDGMQPVGLFNRFDLAAADGSHCGEHRIVYAKTSGGGIDRFFIIFEATVDNPLFGTADFDPAAPLAGCQGIAMFWQGLTGVGDEVERATRLANFYYDGDTNNDGTMDLVKPVVHFDNYGMPLGQIRGNLFMMQPWLLREWRTDNPADPGVAIETVKDNPLVEYYENAGSNGFDATRTADFQAEFGAVTFGNLFGVDQMVPDPLALSAFDVVSCFGAGFSDTFNEFQGIAQGSTDNPRFHDQSDVQAVINTELTNTGLNAQGFSLDHTLNRAGAMTCGGCHQFTANQPIAPGPDGIAGNADDLRWPFSGGFVHINESGNLSPALTQMFLPARQGVLQDYLCDGCGATDTDGDQVRDNCDNCVDVSNADQADADGDSIGDACDPQTCGNGVLEDDEECDDGNLEDGDGCAANCTNEDDPPAECCVADADCGYQESCVIAEGSDFGVCAPNATGDDCWTDSDCGAYGECTGAVLCACDDVDCVPTMGSCGGDDPEPPVSCGIDGSTLTCDAAAPACASEQIPAVTAGCFTGGCIDDGQCDCHQGCHNQGVAANKKCVKMGHDRRKCARFGAQIAAECAEACIAPEPVEPPAAPPAEPAADAAARAAQREKTAERAAVDAARVQLKTARGDAGKAQARQALKAAVDHARQVERSKLGLRGVRRAH